MGFFDSIGDFLGGVSGGDVFGGVTSLLGGAMQNRQNQVASREQRKFDHDEAILARTFNANEALKGRLFNGREAARDRNWQQWNADHTHSREVRDLKRAGLNPILSVNHGSPVPASVMASSPTASGPAAHGSMPHMEDILSRAVSTALQSKQVRTEAKQREAATQTQMMETKRVGQEAENARKAGVLLDLDADIKRATPEYIRAQTAATYAGGRDHEMHSGVNQAEQSRVGAETKRIEAETELLRERVTNTRLEQALIKAGTAKDVAEVEKIRAELPGLLKERDIDQSDYGAALRYINRILPVISTAAEVVKGAAGGAAAYKYMKDSSGTQIEETSTYKGRNGDPDYKVTTRSRH